MCRRCAEGARSGSFASRTHSEAVPPTLVETPGFYDPQERDLRVVSADGRHAILFVVRDGKVTAFRSGLRDAVEYVEGCQ